MADTTLTDPIQHARSMFAVGDCEFDEEAREETTALSNGALCSTIARDQVAILDSLDHLSEALHILKVDNYDQPDRARAILAMSTLYLDQLIGRHFEAGRRVLIALERSGLAEGGAS